MAVFVSTAGQWCVLFFIATLRSGRASCEMVDSSYTIPGSCTAAGISTCCSGDSCGGIGGCQCDSSCFKYGDCCSDIFATCPQYLAPMNVTIHNVTEAAVSIRWTMQYVTPDELFQVTYRSSTLSSNHTLTLGVIPLVEDCIYSIVVTGLQPSTVYTVEVAASHSAGRSTSERVNFTTYGVAAGDTATIQVRAGPFVSCEDWDDHVTIEIQAFFTTNLARVLGTLCKCVHAYTLLANETTKCSHTKTGQAYGVYRSTLSGTATQSVRILLEGLQQWLNTHPYVRSGITNIAFDRTCPLEVSIGEDPLCSGVYPTPAAYSPNVTEPVINKTSGYTLIPPSVRQEASCITLYMLIAAMVAELLVLVAIVMLATVIALCLVRNRFTTKHSRSSRATPSSCVLPAQQTAENHYHTQQISPPSGLSEP